MAEITMELLKELRERTGIGIGKCKDALREANGNVEQAIKELRKAGLASAVKKEGRDTKEGLISTAQNDEAIALIQVMAETDFVVSNDIFQDFVKALTQEALASKPASAEAFLAQPHSKDPSNTIDQYRSLTIQSLGENIQLKSVFTLAKKSGHSYGIYSHMGGKIVVLVELNGTGEEEFARSLAMHAAAEAPEYLTPEEIPAEVISHEKEIASAQVKGKPENILEKIVGGKMEKFFNRVCLLRQKYVRDPDHTVAEIVKARAKEAGKDLSVVSFIRLSVGE